MVDKNPYLKEHESYFKRRKLKHILCGLPSIYHDLLIKQKGICTVCKQPISELDQEQLDIHHILPKKSGGSNLFTNLMLLHSTCHQNVTHSKDPILIARYVKEGILKIPASSPTKKKAKASSIKAKDKRK